MAERGTGTGTGTGTGILDPAGVFTALFGRPPTVLATAPGRVNLIGEHTDYNDGYVLPIAIPQRTRVDLALRDDRRVRVWSAQAAVGESGIVDYTLGEETPRQHFIDYVAGVTRALLEAGFAIEGFDACIHSEVPLGSGLSSSAALEVSLLRALREACKLQLDDVRLALLGQRAENDFVGAPVGVMDQMASSLAGEDAALFLDTRTLAYERVPLPRNVELIVIDSGIPHSHVTGSYRIRRAECARAASLLGVAALRDLDAGETTLARLAQLPDPIGRRARHVVTENQRVLDAVRALRAENLATLGALLVESHHSMRDDFEVSLPAIDRLVEIALEESSVYGARLTGGGFGGSIVALARRGTALQTASRIAAKYATRTPYLPSVLVPADVVRIPAH